MALTTILKENREFKELINSSMPSKKSFTTNTGRPPFSSKNPIIVPYSLDNSYQASLVGTASDYMFRFIIAKTVSSNKEDVIKDLVAEKGLQLLTTRLYKKFNLGKDDETNDKIKSGLEKRKAYFDKCKDTIKRYINGDEQLFYFLITTSVWFAQLDAVFRNKSDDSIKIAFMKEKEPLVEKEVMLLCEVFIETFINSNIVTSDSDVVFNPTFGEWSKKVGGADADIFIDGTLYDFKCTKNVSLQWDYCAQIFSYYILGLLDKQNGCIGSLAEREIKNISLYYSRFGLINTCYLATSDAKYDADFLKSTKDIIEQEYNELEAFNNAAISLNGFKPSFPEFTNDYIDKEKYGALTVEDYLSRAFPSYEECGIPTILQKPIFWSGCNIPDIVNKEKLFYIIRFKSCFYIKEGYEPFVYNRVSFLYPIDKALASSEVYDCMTGKCYDKYVNSDGSVVISRPILTLTKEDYLLFLEYYKTSDLEIMDGCYFK